VIFDIVEYYIIEGTMPNESRICKDMQEGAYPKKRRRVLLANFPQSSIRQKRIDGLKN
jgi:hypothetical protein